MLTALTSPAGSPQSTGSIRRSDTPPADTPPVDAPLTGPPPATRRLRAARVRACARWAAEPTAAAVPLIRSRVRAALDGWRVTPDIADVLLLAVSELTGNVVLHAPAASRMRVGITLRGGWLLLDVTDSAPSPTRLPHPRAGIEADAESGRGLLIVGLMAAEVGGELAFSAAEFGTSVQVRVPAA